MDTVNGASYQNAAFSGSTTSVDLAEETSIASSNRSKCRIVGKCLRTHFTRERMLRRIPFLQWIRRYTLSMLLSDFIAGLTVGFTVIPQSIGYAAVAGLPLQYGLYSSFMGPLLYIFLGTVNELSIGPTAIMALMTFSYAHSGGAEYAILLTFLAGFIELVAGLLNLGVMIEFISTPVIAGFCSAAALTVASTQLKGLLGLNIKGSAFLSIWIEAIRHIQETRLWDAVLGFTAILVLLSLRKLNRVKNLRCLMNVKWLRNPAVERLMWFVSTSRNAIAVIFGCVIAYCLEQRGIQPFTLTGNIKPGLPPFEWPSFNINKTIDEGMEELSFVDIVSEIGTAIGLIPLIAILEQIAIAKAFAAGRKTDANQEMIALGVANIVGSFFGSMPISASFGRSSVQSSSGVQTPMANLYVGGLVLLALGFLMPSLSYIPKPILAAVIITSVIFMVEYHELKPMWRSKRLELLPFLFTFFSCLVNVEYGLLSGTALHLLLMSFLGSRPQPKMKVLDANKGVIIVAEANLYYPGVERFRRVLTKATQSASQGSFVIIDLHKMNDIDYTALKMLKSVSTDVRQKGASLKLLNANESIRCAVSAILAADHYTMEPANRSKTSPECEQV